MCTSSEVTPFGTPCSKAWSPEWIQIVCETESKLGKRVCGARTLAGNPCMLSPNHENGRCRFHGGFDLTGAPKGNRNGVIHGLYSRRLRQCSAGCPQWGSCPCAGEEVREIPAPDRPQCPYERLEYNTALTDLQGMIEHTDRGVGPVR